MRLLQLNLPKIQMSKTNLATVNHIASLLQTQASVLFVGLDALATLRDVFVEAQRQLGVEVFYDTSSDPSLQQLVAGATLGAVDGALKGAVAGLVVGAIFRDVRLGMAVGAAVGAASGAVYGVHRVHQGWRVHLAHDSEGVPFAELSATPGEAL